MAQAIKSITDAVIALVVALNEFHSGQVYSFDGDVETYLARRAPVLPFVGVRASGGDLPSESYSTQNKAPTENITITLTLVAQDWRGAGYTLETAYPLVDALVNGLIGASLSLSGVAPLQVNRWSQVQELADLGLTVYEIQLSTWQVR